MPTVMTDFRRHFASRQIAVGMMCTVLLSGCSFMGGGKTPGENPESRQEAPKPDAFAETRAQMTLAPREPYWPYHLAELHLGAGSSAEAIEQLNASLALDPNYAPSVSLLSHIYYDAHMYPQAVNLLEGYLSRNAQAPDALRASLALNYEAMGDADKADAALASCTAGARDAQCPRVLASLRKNDKTALLADAKKALEADDHSAVNHNNYGIALLVAGRPFDARDEFKKALDLDGNLAGALYNMAIVQTFYFFDDTAGRDWYARYLKVDTDDPDNLKAHFDAVVTSTEPAEHKGKP